MSAINAVVPLNVAALRVSMNDSTNVVARFKGRVAAFDDIPWQAGAGAASTGDTVVQPLEDPDSPLNPLGAGIHVHWQLPDYFRRGVQPLGSEEVVFPQVPNRWLVTRWLSVWDAGTSQWGAAEPASWVVESDFMSATLLADSDGTLRPAAPVPLMVTAPQPYGYMGRVVDAAAWDPAGEPAASYLPQFTGEDGKPAYLTANGFLGPGFSSYYPDCCSVFGYWDRFLDVPHLQEAITGNQQSVKFRASYQVTGWIQPGAPDPLDAMEALVREEYDRHVAACADQGVPVATTPAEVFGELARQRLHWTFRLDAVSYTLNDDGTLATIDLPARTLCAGTLQEVVWQSDSTSYFLNNPDNTQDAAVWTDTVEVAVGNTPPEALAALLKRDLGNTDGDPDLLDNYEYLLDALQLGLLRELESRGNKLIALEEALHSAGFAQQQGGVEWVVQPRRRDPGRARDAGAGITLPLPLAESLSLLNAAQKAYDMARDGLEVLRRQLFMDWYRYVKMYAGNVASPNVNVNQLGNFLSTAGTGELAAVVAAGAAAGVLQYLNDPVSGAVTGIAQPAAPAGGAASAAYTVWTRLAAFRQALAAHPEWEVLGVPAPPFWQPAEPVVMVEGSRIEPVRRNGTAAEIRVRSSGEVLGALAVSAQGSTFTVAASAVGSRPVVNPQTPALGDVQALLGEAVLLVPSLAPAVAAALAAQGGAGNPAAADAAAFSQALNAAQGGLSPLAGGPGAGLFAAVRTDHPAAANPSQYVASPQALTFTFTNAAASAWPPDPVAWNAQRVYPEFSSTRADPFIPVSLVWTLSLDPLQQAGAGGGYAPTTLADWFALDADAVDYQYRMVDGAAAPFTTGTAVAYTGSVALSQKPVHTLTRQIDGYVAGNPGDPANPALREISARYRKLRTMAQAASGFGAMQTLQGYVAQIPVEDLTMGPRDGITPPIDAAATAQPADDWYDLAFNARAPIATGFPAQYNFGPLRAGFLEVTGLEIVDVWGQRMDLSTAESNPDGSLQVTAALTVSPRSGDTAHAGMVYLPPRVLYPTRLWFRWLSAAHDAAVPGVDADFVEASSHPATSPVCGWIVPNHLDGSLFFYDARGEAIGSFGVEHGELVYRTRAGNTANPSDSLRIDIGPPGVPRVNPHTARLMWHVDGRDAAFLADLMAAILASDGFISPAGAARDPSLAVLMGQPLAITRAVLGLETAGGLLPISQADVAPTGSWPQDVINLRTAYADRMRDGSAGLGGVLFPARLGDLANLDDGLVGFFVERAGDEPYTTFYAPAAPAAGGHGVAAPTPQTLPLALNAAPLTLTLLVDPRAAVHATVGVLPVQELSIPPDQYARTLDALQVTFFTLPVLNERQRLVLPLPPEPGYAWSWVSPGAVPAVPLATGASNGNAAWGYTPQRLLEGWLRLAPLPGKPS